ncbi:MAG TPA: hypothetical protein VLE72_03225 [Candidatus Saccharimonadales bacterium]|nr:hypothetical protein [Candidatus Saccharimonadales bacterium]
MAKKAALKNLSLNPLSLALIIIGAVVLGYFIASGHAASPGGGSSSIKLDQTGPYLGGLATFTSTYPRLTDNTAKYPRVEVLCFQDVNGDGMVTSTDALSPDLVYGEGGSANQTYQKQISGFPGFILGGSSSKWLTRGGSATCKANLFYYAKGKGAATETYVPLATTGTWTAAGAR